MRRDDDTLFVTASVGDRVVFPCNATKLPVIWKFQANTVTSSEEFKRVVDGGVVQNGHKSKFSLDTSETGRQDLVLRNASLQDEGLYRCNDENGFGPDHDVRLSVKSGCSHAVIADHK